MALGHQRIPNPSAFASSIGVYDSGVGGLSVLRALKSTLPRESFSHVADCGHAPYGDRSASFVEGHARDIAGFLTRRGAKALVIACNTASVVAVQRLRELCTLPIVAMEPAIKPATQVSRSKVVRVLAHDPQPLRRAAMQQLRRGHAGHPAGLSGPGRSGRARSISR